MVLPPLKTFKKLKNECIIEIEEDENEVTHSSELPGRVMRVGHAPP